MVAMPRRARVVTWNGKDVPPELRELPAGRYIVEAVEEEAPVLSPEEEAGIGAARESYRQRRVVATDGEGGRRDTPSAHHPTGRVPHPHAPRQIIAAALGR